MEHEQSLVEAVKQVDAVICSIPSKQVLDQRVLIRVIKESGSIKVFVCSLFFYCCLLGLLILFIPFKSIPSGCDLFVVMCICEIKVNLFFL